MNKQIKHINRNKPGSQGWGEGNAKNRYPQEKQCHAINSELNTGTWWNNACTDRVYR